MSTFAVPPAVAAASRYDFSFSLFAIALTLCRIGRGKYGFSRVLEEVGMTRILDMVATSNLTQPDSDSVLSWFEVGEVI